MLKGRPPRVTYHQVYKYTKTKVLGRWVTETPRAAGVHEQRVALAPRSNTRWSMPTLTSDAVEPEQWLQRHPKAGLSWPSWSQASNTTPRAAGVLEQRVALALRPPDPGRAPPPLSSKHGTHQTVKARFRPLFSGKSPSDMGDCNTCTTWVGVHEQRVALALHPPDPGRAPPPSQHVQQSRGRLRRLPSGIADSLVVHDCRFPGGSCF